MYAVLALISRATNPYFSSLKRQLSEKGIAPLTIGNTSNVLGHPIGLTILALTGNFLLPHDRIFFLYWGLLIVVVAVGFIFVILGLTNTKFFTAQVIGQLGFASAAIWAAILVGEKLTGPAVIALTLGVAGVICFSWNKAKGEIFQFDRGTLFTIMSVILGGLAAVLYKLATKHTSSFGELFTGRFLGDYVAWNGAWLISLWYTRRNPARELAKILRDHQGLIFVIGTIVITSLDTLLIKKLSVTTLAILGTISFPVTYLFSYFKFRERVTLYMWVGTACILASIFFYLALK